MSFLCSIREVWCEAAPAARTGPPHSILLGLAPQTFRERYLDQLVATHDAPRRHVTGWRSGLFSVL